MRIVIADGSPEAGGLSRHIDELCATLRSRGHAVSLFTLRDMQLSHCTGCFSCWWGPTCGRCARGDDSGRVWAGAVKSDLIIFASPVIMGFLSALTKRLQDKIIVLVHPHIDVVDGECRHRRRYARYPRWGLLLERTPGTDDEDISIIEGMERHAALNLRSRLCMSATTERAPGDIADEIDRL